MKNNYTIKTSKFQVKESDDDSMTIKAYGSVFGNLDSDNDTIQKGAYTKTIKENGPDGRDMVKLVAQHDISRPIAKITSMKEDDYGLLITAKFGDWTDSNDYYKMMKAGVINELSVGFKAIEKEENEKGGYDIKEIKLYEISAVTVAANDKAVVMDVKSNDPLKLIKQVKDKELAFKLEKEMLKLMSNVQETSTQPEVNDVGVKEISPEPEVEQKSLTSDLLTLYKQ